jgi:transposase
LLSLGRSSPYAPRQQIHIILDNLSAHKTMLVREFLEQHPNVHFHFAPTYSSCLNQVELWSSNIEREVIVPWCLRVCR